MSDAFDPYYIWLGIPPEEQPPHHYRLLGVTLFENNREVIEAAANRQMAYMQEVSGGEAHIDEAQKILGELSRARVCLLSAEKKEAYDIELRASFDTIDEAGDSAERPAVEPSAESTAGGVPTAPTEPATPIPPQKKSADAGPLIPPQFGKTSKQSESVIGAPQLGQAATHSPKVGKQKRKKQNSSLVIVLPSVILVVLFIVATMFFVSSQNAKKEAARKAAIKKKESERRAQEEADRKAAGERKKQAEADRKAKEDADRKAKEEADRKLKEETARKAKENADRKAKEEADRKAKEDADRKAKEEAKRKEKEDADRKAKEEADRKAKDAERKEKDEAASEAKKILEDSNLQERDGTWEPIKQWTAYRDLSRQLGLLKQGKPIPMKGAKAKIDRMRAQYEANLTKEIEDLYTRYGKQEGGQPVFVFDSVAIQSRYYELLRIANSRFYGKVKRANQATKDAVFYEWASKQPQLQNFYVIPNQNLINQFEKKLDSSKRAIKFANKKLTKKLEVKNALESLGHTLRPAPQ